MTLPNALGNYLHKMVSMVAWSSRHQTNFQKKNHLKNLYICIDIQTKDLFQIYLKEPVQPANLNLETDITNMNSSWNVSDF